MPIYERVGYELNSRNRMVQACLQFKKDAASPDSPHKIPGIAYASCFSAVSVVGKQEIIFGNSRNKVPYLQTKLACVHGECNAIWEAMEEANGVPRIGAMYIEIHPCPNCRAFLANVLGAEQVVYYSFEYSPDGLKAWQSAAKALCK